MAKQKIDWQKLKIGLRDYFFLLGTDKNGEEHRHFLYALNAIQALIFILFVKIGLIFWETDVITAPFEVFISGGLMLLCIGVFNKCIHETKGYYLLFVVFFSLGIFFDVQILCFFAGAILAFGFIGNLILDNDNKKKKKRRKRKK